MSASINQMKAKPWRQVRSIFSPMFASGLTETCRVAKMLTCTAASWATRQTMDSLMESIIEFAELEALSTNLYARIQVEWRDLAFQSPAPFNEKSC